MKLSILLPTHGRPDVLPFAIESVLAQTFTDFELLVCGDGCLGDEEDIVQGYASRDPRVKWFSFPKAPGVGYANWNRVLRTAAGDLIGFMAHDDLITDDHFALLVQSMDAPQVQLAHTGSAWISRDGHVVPTVFSLEDKAMREEFLAKRWNRIAATCFIHRRSAFIEMGYWSEELPRGGDLDIWGRILRHHGAGALRSLTTITCLHFRAIWRPDELAPDSEPVWQELHHAAGRFASIMHWPVQPGTTEQETFWRRMRAEAQVVPTLRAACQHALMTYAWHLEQHLSAQRGLVSRSRPTVIEGLQAKIASLKEQLNIRNEKLSRVRRERDSLKTEIAGLKLSRRWWWRLFQGRKRPPAGGTASAEDHE